ncbi:MAG: hypothetical protein FJX74_08015 [Armatimonadetes bacterium]|nr:hypothetical protein [Armatimonadota bacterium]
MLRLTTALLGLSCLACSCTSAQEWTVYPEGPLEYTVLAGDGVRLQVGCVAWGPQWRWFGFGGQATAADGRRTLVASATVGGTDRAVEVTHEAWQRSDREIVLTYEFHAPAQADFTQICATLSPDMGAFAGGSVTAVLAGGEEKPVALPFGRGNVGEAVEALILRDGAGAEVRVALAPPRPVSMDGDGRLQLVGASMAAGETRRTELALTLPAAARFIASDADSFERDDTAEWFPYPVGPEGVPTDLSFLNRDTQGNFVPAGAHGFVTVKGDDFVFEDGTPARFWGVNLTAGAVLTSEERAVQLADRLARLGANIVRFHHLDSWANPIVDYSHPDGTTQHLSPASMRLLDRAVFELKQRGIYVVLDPWVQRCFTAADGVADYGNLGNRGNFNLHPYVYFDPRMQELIQGQWRSVWTHVNEFTGVAYKDEPACAMTEVINEGLLGGLDGVRPGPYRDTIRAQYDQWAQANGGAPFEQSNIFTQNFGDNNLRFFTFLHKRFYRQSHDFFRRIGVRIPINATNWGHFTWIMAAQADLDYMDSHHYYGGDRIGPGSGLGGLWLNHPPGLPDSPFGRLGGFAVQGKPVTSSENGNNPPKTYRAAYQVGLAAAAAFQGWDSITGYAYSQAGSPRDTLSDFEWESDPASLASLAVGALLYRRGDVSPARETVAMLLPEEEILTLRWENGGEKQYWNTPGFNVALDQHRIAVSLPGQDPAALDPAETLTVDDALGYRHPNTETRSDTGELWRDWTLGVGTIDTPRTQVAYGKLGESATAWRTQDCAFDISTPFAVVALSSLTDEPLAASGRMLLTAVARAQNTGMAFNMARTKVTANGAAPVIAEPVVGTVRLRTTRPALALYPIRVDGTRGPGIELAVKDGLCEVPLTAASQTIFYEIEAAAN